MPDTYDARPLDVIYDQAIKAEVGRLAHVAGKALGLIVLGDNGRHTAQRIANAQRALDAATELLEAQQ